MRSARCLFGFSLCALLALALLASPALADEEKGEAKDGLLLKVGPQDVPMEDFLRVIAKATGVPLVWNPADKNIRGKKIIGNVDMNMPRDELFAYTRALLTFYELVMIPVGPTGHQVHLVMDARQTSSILKLKPEHVVLTDENLASYADDDGRFITTTITVKHMDDLRNARNALTRIVTGQNIGNVTEVPSANAFVITDFAPNVVAIYRLLKEMDKPQVKPSTTTGRTVAITLEHATAFDLARMLALHYAAKPSAGPRGAPRNPQPVSKATAPRVTADTRTNRILVTGAEAEIKAVQAAIALLDVPVFAPSVSAHLIKLTHITANQVSGAITALIRTSPNLWAGAGSRPTVIAHDQTNSLLVSAANADLAKIQALVAQMDKKQE